MNHNTCMGKSDYGPNPYVANIEEMAKENTNFRTAIWTGCYLQMTLMSIPVCGDVGVEIHEDTDQFIRVEQGIAMVRMGECKESLQFKCQICQGEGVFIPLGTWHNIINIGKCPLKLSSIYAPPHHKKGTIHRTKEIAERKM